MVKAVFELSEGEKSDFERAVRNSEFPNKKAWFLGKINQDLNKLKAGQDQHTERGVEN